MAGEQLYVDPVRGLIMGPPPTNGAGSPPAPVDSFAAIASLMALVADPAATAARLSELQSRETELVKLQNALAAQEARLAKKEQALDEKGANLQKRDLDLQAGFSSLEQWKKQARIEHDAENADQAQDAHYWRALCAMVAGGIDPREAGDAHLMGARQTAANLIELVMRRARPPKTEPELPRGPEPEPFPPGLTLTGGGREPKASPTQSRRGRL